jgi:hypothetical protein
MASDPRRDGKGLCPGGEWKDGSGSLGQADISFVILAHRTWKHMGMGQTTQVRVSGLSVTWPRYPLMKRLQDWSRLQHLIQMCPFHRADGWIILFENHAIIFVVEFPSYNFIAVCLRHLNGFVTPGFQVICIQVFQAALWIKSDFSNHVVPREHISVNVMKCAVLATQVWLYVQMQEKPISQVGGLFSGSIYLQASEGF